MLKNEIIVIIFFCFCVFRFANGAVYDGEWNMGKKHGRGVFTYPDGSKYDGMLSMI